MRFPVRSCGLALGCLMLVALGACGGGSGDPVAPQPPAAIAPPQPAPAWHVLVDGSGASAWGSDVVGLTAGGGGAVFVGSYTGDVVMGFGALDAVVLNSVSLQDAYVARVNEVSGALSWVATIEADALGYVVVQEVVETSLGVSIVGYFEGDVTFRHATGLVGTTLPGEGLVDGFVARYDVLGNFQDVRGLTSPGWVECEAASATADGGSIVGGLFEGPMTPGGIGSTLVPVGPADGFVLRYGSGGGHIWSTQFASEAGGFVSVWGVDVLQSAGEDVIVTGDFQGTATFAPAEIHASVGASIDSFIARLDGASGALEWVRFIGGGGAEQVFGVDSNSIGFVDHILVSGGFEGTATFGDIGGVPRMLTSAGSHDGFVAAFGSAGELEWAESVGGTGDDFFYDAWVRSSDGALMATGYFTGQVAFSGSTVTLTSHGSGDVDAMLAGFTPGGSVQWALAIGGVADDYGTGIAGVPGAFNDVYAVGSVQGSGAEIGPGSGGISVLGDDTGYLVRFDATTGNWTGP